jgi:glycosyltransferase involved in cell wall biosynthesis
MDSQHPEIRAAGEMLERGSVPAGFGPLTERLVHKLGPILAGFDLVILHNLFTKHFNLPLTTALHRLLDAGAVRRCIAWCHDLSWTSPSSRERVHSGYPWDLLRTYRPDVIYVAVSEERRRSLAELFGQPAGVIRVIYNGVDAAQLLGLTQEGWSLSESLDLFESYPVLLMPVRVTRAKNIEYALSVVAALKRRGYGPKLVVTGPPDPHDSGIMAYFASLQELRKRLGVEQELRFVFESGPQTGEPYIIDYPVVGDLLRVSDALFRASRWCVRPSRLQRRSLAKM